MNNRDRYLIGVCAGSTFGIFGMVTGAFFAWLINGASRKWKW